MESALLFSSGYAANLGVIPALVGEEDLIFSDVLNHASLIDGARLSGARKILFQHNDPVDLARLLEKHRGEGRRALVVQESVYSMEGSRAPIAEIGELATQHDCWWMVDEAHSLGVLGEGGRGLTRGRRPDVLVGTLGKAFGVAGAFVACHAQVREWFVHRARSFVFSTALPPILVDAISEALAEVHVADAAREVVLRHGRRLREGLRGLGCEVLGEGTPIVPWVLGEPEMAVEMEKRLRAVGILARAIRPPTVPAGTSRIRFVPTAAHTDEDVDRLLEAVERFT